jgi:tyrosyl-tRNA synthetase
MYEGKMNIEEQVNLLMQGTEYGDDELKQTMTVELRQRLKEAEKEGRKLRVYCGYDPTKADLHLGHTITMRKLRQFQDLGHEVNFVIGNYTTLIGDPSDHDKLRPQLTAEVIEANARTYAEQAFRILDPKKTKIRYNAEWLSKLTFADLIRIGSNFTIQQFLTRENFKLRWEKGDAVYLHETFYALMQGYDAFALKADVQVGGTEQLFNIVTAARKVMAYLGERPNIAILMGILPGTDGVIRMSKSLGNYIPINTDADDMYGKVMSIPDFAMPIYFKLVTRWSPQEVQQTEKALQEGNLHPRDAKMKLAFEVASSFWGDADAKKAQQNFVKTFQKKDVPDDIPVYAVKKDQSVLDVLIDAHLVGSKSEGRRMLDQNGVKLDGNVLSDANATLPKEGILQVGKRHFLKLN